MKTVIHRTLHSDAIVIWIVAHHAILLLSLITGIGLFLRFYALGSESIWFDEAASIYSAKRPIIDMLKDCVGWHRHPPLHFVTLKIWINIFGDSEVAVRTISAILGTASIPLIYLVGKQILNERVGLIASFLLAISAHAIYYSQETRSYAMLLFFTLLSFVLFIRIMKSSNTNKWYYLFYFVTNTLLVYTHYFGLFVVASQIFYFILVRRYEKINTRFFWYAQIATGIAFLPWAVVFVGYSIPRSWSWERPAWGTIISTLSEYSGHGGGQAFLLLIFLCLFVLGIFSIKRCNSEWFLKKPIQTLKQLCSGLSFQRETLLPLVWFLFPIGMPFLISQIPLEYAGIYATRYTISALPAFYLLAAKGLSNFTNRKALFPLLAVILIAITGFSYPGLQHYYTHYEKAQWREAVNLVELLSQEHDIIMLNYGGSDFRMPFEYYYKGDLELLDIEQGGEVQAIVDFVASGKQRIWFIQGPWGATATRDYLMERYESSLILKEEFNGVLVLLFNLPFPK